MPFSSIQGDLKSNQQNLTSTQIAMIGCGSMGGGMALLFAENGLNVSLQDPSEEMMDSVIEKAEKAGYHNKIKKYKGNYTSPAHTSPFQPTH